MYCQVSSDPAHSRLIAMTATPPVQLPALPPEGTDAPAASPEARASRWSRPATTDLAGDAPVSVSSPHGTPESVVVFYIPIGAAERSAKLCLDDDYFLAGGQ